MQPVLLRTSTPLLYRLYPHHALSASRTKNETRRRFRSISRAQLGRIYSTTNSNKIRILKRSISRSRVSERNK